MERPIVTRKEALAQGLPRYFTGGTCKHGHVDERYSSNWMCVACTAEVNARDVTSGAAAARNKQRRIADPAKAREQDRRMYKAHQEKKREDTRRWKAKNPNRHAAQQGWRHAGARGALLPTEFIDAASLITATEYFYAEARRLTEQTGTVFEVDHILPIERGGSHHPRNMRVVPRTFNRRKRTSTDCEVLERIDAGRWSGDVDLAVAIASQNCPNYLPGQLSLPF